MTVFRTICVFVCLMTTAILAQKLSVSPSSVSLGEFPTWERHKVMFTIKNTLERPVSLLRVRSSCSCTMVDFTPSTLGPGHEMQVPVAIPANSLSGKFTRMVYLETDAPGQEFLQRTICGEAIPPVKVQPGREIYLGRLEAGKARRFSFRLVPASPDMSLKLLPADEGNGQADATLLRNDDTTFTMELNFTPDASRRYVAIRRRIAIEWTHDSPPLALTIMFSTEKSASQ